MVKSQMLGLIKVTVNTNQVDIVDLLEKDYDDKEDICFKMFLMKV